MARFLGSGTGPSRALLQDAGLISKRRMGQFEVLCNVARCRHRGYELSGIT